METAKQIKLTLSKANSLADNSEKFAAEANLIFTTDSSSGIRRIKRGKKFTYIYNKQIIKDKNILKRIKALAIPPAWKNVWICKSSRGHIQTTGIDVRNRKQYKYHPLWSQLRSQTKFYRLAGFGESLPQLRIQLEKDISQQNLNERKVIATVIRLMEQTYIRIGNASYEKLYNSHGLTTLKDKHVRISGEKISFAFKGKKGIFHNISIRNKRLAKIVKQCRDIPGKELFQYKEKTGKYKAIDSGKINSYIKEITGYDYTAKDFRTWAGSLSAISAFRKISRPDSSAKAKKNIVTALDTVSSCLGNSRAVCKKYYVHPAIIELYENNKLHDFFEKDSINGSALQGLSNDENLLLCILKSTNRKSEIILNDKYS